MSDWFVSRNIQYSFPRLIFNSHIGCFKNNNKSTKHRELFKWENRSARLKYSIVSRSLVRKKRYLIVNKTLYIISTTDVNINDVLCSDYGYGGPDYGYSGGRQSNPRGVGKGTAAQLIHY